MAEVMSYGAIPVVPMPQAQGIEGRYLELPVSLRHVGYKSEGAREKRKGKGARRRSGDDAEAKSLIELQRVGTHSHEGAGGRTCTHDVWALDGSLVAVPSEGLVTLDAVHVPCVDMWWEVDDVGRRLFGRFRIPCRSNAVEFEHEFSGKEVPPNKRARKRERHSGVQKNRKRERGNNEKAKKSEVNSVEKNGRKVEAYSSSARIKVQVSGLSAVCSPWVRFTSICA